MNGATKNRGHRAHRSALPTQTITVEVWAFWFEPGVFSKATYPVIFVNREGPNSVVSLLEAQRSTEARVVIPSWTLEPREDRLHLTLLFDQVVRCALVLQFKIAEHLDLINLLVLSGMVVLVPVGKDENLKNVNVRDRAMTVKIDVADEFARQWQRVKSRVYRKLQDRRSWGEKLVDWQSSPTLAFLRRGRAYFKRAPWEISLVFAFLLLAVGLLWMGQNQEGFAGNIVAEFVGLIVGVLGTVLILDRLLSRREQKRWQESRHIAQTRMEWLIIQWVNLTIGRLSANYRKAVQSVQVLGREEVATAAKRLRHLEEAKHHLDDARDKITNEKSFPDHQLKAWVQPCMQLIPSFKSDLQSILGLLLDTHSEPELIDRVQELESALSRFYWYGCMIVSPIGPGVWKPDRELLFSIIRTSVTISNEIFDRLWQQTHWRVTIRA